MDLVVLNEPKTATEIALDTEVTSLELTVLVNLDVSDLEATFLDLDVSYLEKVLLYI